MRRGGFIYNENIFMAYAMGLWGWAERKGSDGGKCPRIVGICTLDHNGVEHKKSNEKASGYKQFSLAVVNIHSQNYQMRSITTGLAG